MQSHYGHERIDLYPVAPGYGPLHPEHQIHPSQHYLLTIIAPSANHLVCITVAERHASNNCPAQGVHDLSHGHVRSNSSHRNNRIHRQGVALRVISIDAVRATVNIHVLPDAEAVVNEGVVHPEDGVAGTGRDIRHDSTNTIVSIGVGTKLQAALHVSIAASRVALVDEVLIALGSVGSIAHSAQAMGSI